MYSDKYKKMAEEGKFDYNKVPNQHSVAPQQRKNLLPLETWLNSDKTVKDLMEMGYSYEEILFGETANGM